MTLGDPGMEVSDATTGRELPHAYDALTNVITICGVKYSGEFFRQISGGLALRRPFELTARDSDGTVMIRTLNEKMIAALPDLCAVLNELDVVFDEQTYKKQAREDFNAPDDREYSVTITAKQLRAISLACQKAGQ